MVEYEVHKPPVGMVGIKADGTCSEWSLLNPESEQWWVGAVDYEREGVMYMAMFEGTDAEKRAREYALFKNYGR